MVALRCHRKATASQNRCINKLKRDSLALAFLIATTLLCHSQCVKGFFISGVIGASTIYSKGSIEGHDNRSRSLVRMMNDNGEWLKDDRPLRPETNFGSENVPEAQRPINEYLDVTNQPFFSWAENDMLGLLLRFFIFYAVMFVTICYPISSATFTQDGYLIQKLVSSNVGALFVSLLLLFRIYSGYEYLGQRLSSKVIEYEETGWYDGDVEEKTSTELQRDRMLYSNQVKPVIDRLRVVGIGGTMLFVGSILLLNVALSAKPMFNQYDPDVLQRLSYDDKLADSAAMNTGGKPAYCDSRYYRAVANGGLGCN
jgi:Conserved in the green lineage and diatoms 27